MYLVEVPQVGSGFATREGPLRGGSFRETTAWSSLYKQLQNVQTRQYVSMYLTLTKVFSMYQR